MFNPDTASESTTWTKEAPCFACSFWMDNFSDVVIHLNHRDVTMAAVSLAPYGKFAAYRQRMGWTFPVYSSATSDFNFDYQVSFREEDLAKSRIYHNYAVTEDPQYLNDEMPGVSIFYKDGNGDIFHTYSAYARGIDMLNNAYNYLDLVPKGRDEAGLPDTMSWVRLRDEYAA
jgi:predicted dithiol-disulfide oxidoreductase (DUF899 family)